MHLKAQTFFCTHISSPSHPTLSAPLAPFFFTHISTLLLLSPEFSLQHPGSANTHAIGKNIYFRCVCVCACKKCRYSLCIPVLLFSETPINQQVPDYKGHLSLAVAYLQDLCTTKQLLRYPTYLLKKLLSPSTASPSWL